MCGGGGGGENGFPLKGCVLRARAVGFCRADTSVTLLHPPEPSLASPGRWLKGRASLWASLGEECGSTIWCGKPGSEGDPLSTRSGEGATNHRRGGKGFLAAGLCRRPHKALLVTAAEALLWRFRAAARESRWSHVCLGGSEKRVLSGAESGSWGWGGGRDVREGCCRF